MKRRGDYIAHTFCLKAAGRSGNRESSDFIKYGNYIMILPTINFMLMQMILYMQVLMMTGYVRTTIKLREDVYQALKEAGAKNISELLQLH